MKIGQGYNGKGKISTIADYVQFNICGLSAIEAVQKYFMYEIEKPLLLLGDCKSYGEQYIPEDCMLSADRIYEIKDIIKTLKAFGAEIIAITLTPMSREGLNKFSSKIKFIDMVNKLEEIFDIPVSMKNTEDIRLFLSTPEEIVDFSKIHRITIDTLFLYKICNQDKELIMNTISEINWNNVFELQIKRVKIGENDFFGQHEIDDCNITVDDIVGYARKAMHLTAMFHGGHKEFEIALKKLLSTFKR